MSDLPDPLTPPDCDLRGFDWMALFGARLFKSTFYRRAIKDPRGGLAGIKLWWESMQQTPAGSLPPDEEELCMLADFGEDMKAWGRCRTIAMYGWMLCSDGRYYHRVVAELALDAWDKRQRARATRQGDADRLRRWRKDRQMSEREWMELRASVFARDGGRCVECGSTDDLHCDHNVELSNGGTNHPDNLITLCRTCHSRKTARAKPNWNDPNPRPPNGGGETHFKQHSETHSAEHFNKHSATHDETSTKSVRQRQDSTRQEREPLTPSAGWGPRRADQSNPRALGTNLRAMGTNPRATAENPRQRQPFKNGFAELIVIEGMPSQDPVTAFMERHKRVAGD